MNDAPDNLPPPLEQVEVEDWLEDFVARSDTVQEAFSGLVQAVYDLAELSDQELTELHRHLKTSGTYAEKFGVIVIMDGRAAGWKPLQSEQTCHY